MYGTANKQTGYICVQTSVLIWSSVFYSIPFCSLLIDGSNRCQFFYIIINKKKEEERIENGRRDERTRPSAKELVAFPIIKK